MTVVMYILIVVLAQLSQKARETVLSDRFHLNKRLENSFAVDLFDEMFE